jgi:hypothetical protein
MEPARQAIGRLRLFTDELPVFVGVFTEEELDHKPTPEFTSKRETLRALIELAQVLVLDIHACSGDSASGACALDPPVLPASGTTQALVAEWVRVHRELCNVLWRMTLPGCVAEGHDARQPDPKEWVQRYLQAVEFHLRQFFS